MIGPHQLMVGVVCGCALIVVGLVPNLFQGLVDGVRNLRDAVNSLPANRHSHEGFRQPVWLAYLGVAVIAFTVLAYATN